MIPISDVYLSLKLTPCFAFLLYIFNFFLHFLPYSEPSLTLFPFLTHFLPHLCTFLSTYLIFSPMFCSAIHCSSFPSTTLFYSFFVLCLKVFSTFLCFFSFSVFFYPLIFIFLSLFHITVLSHVSFFFCCPFFYIPCTFLSMYFPFSPMSCTAIHISTLLHYTFLLVLCSKSQSFLHILMLLFFPCSFYPLFFIFRSLFHITVLSHIFFFFCCTFFYIPCAFLSYQCISLIVLYPALLSKYLYLLFLNCISFFPYFFLDFLYSFSFLKIS